MRVSPDPPTKRTNQIREISLSAFGKDDEENSHLERIVTIWSSFPPTDHDGSLNVISALCGWLVAPRWSASQYKRGYCIALDDDDSQWSPKFYEWKFSFFPRATMTLCCWLLTTTGKRVMNRCCARLSAADDDVCAVGSVVLLSLDRIVSYHP